MIGGIIVSEIIKIGETDDDNLISLSVSRVRKWRKCQMAYDWRYVHDLEPARKALPLTRGSWLHQCLEARDSGEDWLEVLKDLKAKEWDPLFAEEKADMGNLPVECYRIMRNYVHHYKDDPYKKTIATELEFKIRIAKTPFVFHGLIDRIAEDKHGRIWCIEHKTVKRIPSDEHRATDIQTAVYLWAMRKISPHFQFQPEAVGGVVFDYLITKPPTVPQLLKNGTMSRRKLFCDIYTYMEELKAHGLDPQDYADMFEKLRENEFYLRRELTRTTESTKRILREMITTGREIKRISGKNPVMSLGYTCEVPRCEFRDLCLTKVEGGDVGLVANTLYKRREKRHD